MVMVLKIVTKFQFILKGCTGVTHGWTERIMSAFINTAMLHGNNNRIYQLSDIISHQITLQIKNT